jgi:Na+-transporting methylmalonyl-CoA/oxaloacetate decarboxylase gamma subunit
MSIADSLLVSVLGLFVVFLVLILLSFLIHIQSIILGYITAYQQRNAEAGHTIIPAGGS